MMTTRTTIGTIYKNDYTTEYDDYEKDYTTDYEDY